MFRQHLHRLALSLVVLSVLQALVEPDPDQQALRVQSVLRVQPVLKAFRVFAAPRDSLETTVQKVQWVQPD